MTLHKVFWSSQAPALPLTITTALTMQRVDALEAQCSSWQGTLSAAVFLPIQGMPQTRVAAGRVLAAKSLPASSSASETDAPSWRTHQTMTAIRSLTERGSKLLLNATQQAGLTKAAAMLQALHDR